ncbi:MAG: hypothetical protein PHD81_03725 [Candidatus Nanoarchaeia archaeon]|nr:hypothetical protein [Candidatus Nanoarchaeia archaeon]MDD5588192.1 hypothetical protein [Candidatus Nanoarchaeia archaeon]
MKDKLLKPRLEYDNVSYMFSPDFIKNTNSYGGLWPYIPQNEIYKDTRLKKEVLNSTKEK